MGKKIQNIEHVVLVCTGSDCRKRGARGVARAVRQCVRDMGKHKVTHCVQMRCSGLCKRGPIVCVQPDNTWLTRATVASAVDTVSARLRAAG